MEKTLKIIYFCIKVLYELLLIKNQKKKKIMAIIKQGILGGLSGKIGSVIGSSWKGIATLKAKPLSVANPRTTGQINQRTKFSNAVSAGQAILSTVIKPLWDRFAIQESGYNAFISKNIDLFASAVPNPIGDLVISKGKMSKTDITAASYNSGTEVLTVEWDKTLKGSFEQLTDIPYLVIVNEETEQFTGIDLTGSATRNSEIATIANASFCNGGDNHAFLAFKRADGTIVSDTSNLDVAYV